MELELIREELLKERRRTSLGSPRGKEELEKKNDEITKLRIDIMALEAEIKKMKLFLRHLA